MENEQKYTLKKQCGKAQIDYVEKWAQQCDYAVTLQTWLPSVGCAVKDATQRAMLRNMTTAQRIQFISNSFYKLRVKLNRALTGNGWLRKNELMPTVFCAIEGATNDYDFNRTLHIHAAFGNLPKALTREMLEDAIRQIWTATDAGVDDIVVKAMYLGNERNWGNYLSKETHIGKFDCIDYTNTQAAQHVLAQIGK